MTAEAGRVTAFATYMTGEIFAAAREHTILGPADAGRHGDAASVLSAASRDGAKPGRPGALLNRLFGVRTAGLVRRDRRADLADYLSGLLIGAEIADQPASDSRPVHIIASDALAERYRSAAASARTSPRRSCRRIASPTAMSRSRAWPGLFE